MIENHIILFITIFTHSCWILDEWFDCIVIGTVISYLSRFVSIRVFIPRVIFLSITVKDIHNLIMNFISKLIGSEPSLRSQPLICRFKVSTFKIFLYVKEIEKLGNTLK